MSRRIAFADVDLSLRLEASDGPLELSAREVAYVRQAGRPTVCRVALVLDAETYRRVDRERLLGLELEARGPGARGFDPVGPVRIDARLAPHLLPELLEPFPEPRAAAERLAELSAAGAPSPLLRTESWLALSVAAERDTPPGSGAGASLTEGYATRWAHEDAPRLSMLAVAEEALERRGWRFEPLEGVTGLRWRMASEAGAWWCFAIAREGEGRFAVYSEIEPVVAEDRRGEAAEVVARLNQGLPIGNWEIDLETGALRFKTSVDVAGDRLSTALAWRLMERNLAVVDACLPALAELAAPSPGRTTR